MFLRLESFTISNSSIKHLLKEMLLIYDLLLNNEETKSKFKRFYVASVSKEDQNMALNA